MTLLSNRTKMMLLTGLVCLFAAGTAAAQTAACVNDNDCPTAECGGDICDWSVVGQMNCKAAGTHPKGQDGWCTTTDNCKCKDLGATCVAAYCTFTRPCDAPGAAGCATGGTSGGTGGGTGTAGTGGGGDSGGCSVAATAPTAASTLLVAIGLLVFARRRRAR